MLIYTQSHKETFTKKSKCCLTYFVLTSHSLTPNSKKANLFNKLSLYSTFNFTLNNHLKAWILTWIFIIDALIQVLLDISYN